MKNYTISMIVTKFRLGFSVLLVSFFSFSMVQAVNSPELGPWSALFYCGGTGKQNFGDVLIGKYSSFGEVIYAVELARTLDQNNVIRRFFKPVFDVVQVAGNVAYRHDYAHSDHVTEGNLYLIWRFSRFPWGHYLKNSVAFGDGISYASHVSYADRELDNPRAPTANRLLNYMIVEVTFALPSHSELELVVRLHHKCTAWGTFSGNPNAGSTNVGLGLRYYF